MCFNMVAISKKRNMLMLLPEIVAEMVTNNDGFFLYSYPNKEYVRTLDIRAFTRKLMVELARSTAIHVHLRSASSGVISEENVHGWKIGKYYVSHNGHVYEYINLYWSKRPSLSYNQIVNGYRLTYSDTYRFVHEETVAEAIKNSNWEELYILSKEKGFHGVMLITDRDFDEVYALTRFKTVKIYKSKDMIIATNNIINIDMKKEEYTNSVIKITIDGIEELYKDETDTIMSMNTKHYNELLF